ncbi:MAG: N-acetyltransferase [Candidatus Omnitrophota bacterium]
MKLGAYKRGISLIIFFVTLLEGAHLSRADKMPRETKLAAESLFAGAHMTETADINWSGLKKDARLQYCVLRIANIFFSARENGWPEDFPEYVAGIELKEELEEMKKKNVEIVFPDIRGTDGKVFICYKNGGKEYGLSIVEKKILREYMWRQDLGISGKYAVLPELAQDENRMKRAPGVRGISPGIINFKQGKQEQSAEESNVKLVPLTRELALRHADNFTGLYNMINGADWTAEQLTADCWEKGQFGQKEKRSFPGKWENSFAAFNTRGEPVGILIAYIRTGSEIPGIEEDSLYIHGLAVDPSCRGMGIGTALIEKAAEMLTRKADKGGEGIKHVSVISLQTGVDNARAQKLYEKTGVKRIGIKKYTDHNDYIYSAYIPRRPGFSGCILDMSDDEILGLFNPYYVELKKHCWSDWMLARKMAIMLGVQEGSADMNLLRVICLSHDLGGVLGYLPDELIEKKINNMLEKHKIQYQGMTAGEIMDSLEGAGEKLSPLEVNLVHT